jgi:hypothetical protein
MQGAEYRLGTASNTEVDKKQISFVRGFGSEAIARMVDCFVRACQHVVPTSENKFIYVPFRALLKLNE